MGAPYRQRRGGRSSRPPRLHAAISGLHRIIKSGAIVVALYAVRAALGNGSRQEQSPSTAPSDASQARRSRTSLKEILAVVTAVLVLLAAMVGLKAAELNLTLARHSTQTVSRLEGEVAALRQQIQNGERAVHSRSQVSPAHPSVPQHRDHHERSPRHTRPRDLASRRRQ